jgi:hypothetical protein
MLCRRRTYKVTLPTDVIPLSNRQAIITSCIAIKAYDTLNWDDGATAEQNAFRFLDEDQAARNLYQRVSAAAETTPTLNLDINTRDSIIVADVYDQACDIFGPIGQQKLFDRITESIELLANMSLWDPLIGYVDINTFNSFYVTLPQYVDQVLAANVNKTAGAFRNQWFEFHMNGLGQDNDNADQVGSNRPCGGWEEVGEMCCAFPLAAPSYLVAYPMSSADNLTPVRAYGIDPTDLPIYGPDGNLGAPITCEQNSFDISGQEQPFKRIDRIVIGSPQSFIQLYATDGTQYLQNLGTFWPNVPEPKFRVIKIGQQAVTVRLKYRKRWLKITSLTDPVHMRSRSALFNAMRSIQTAQSDPMSANVLIMAAKDQLNKEWRATHPNEELIINIDPSIWGGSMVTMPAILLPLLASIKGLFPIGGPADVAGLVAAIIVYTVYRVLGTWRITNFFVKCLERLQPFRKYLNAALPIIANIAVFLGLQHAIFHALPGSPNLGLGQAMAANSLTGNLFAKTTTTSTYPITKDVLVDSNQIPAIALTEPPDSIFGSSIFRTRQNNQASKALASQITEGGH